MNIDDPPPSPPAAGMHGGKVRWVGLDEIVDSESYRLRRTEAVGVLAESLIRHGQREAVDLRAMGSGLQLLNGHRRLEASRMLGRDRILGRIHEGLGDEDALLMALSDDLDRRAWSSAERASLRSRLESAGDLSSKVIALLDRAEEQARQEEEEAAGEHEVEDVDADLMAASVRDRLADACNDLAALHDLWADLDEGRRADLVECVAYLKDMYPFLASTEKEDP